MDEGIDAGGVISLDCESIDLRSDLSDFDSLLESDIPEDLSEGPSEDLDDLFDIDSDLPEDVESACDLPQSGTESLEDDISEDLIEGYIDETSFAEPDIPEDVEYQEVDFESIETEAPINDTNEGDYIEKDTSSIVNNSFDDASEINIEEDVLGTEIARKDEYPSFDSVEEKLSQTTPLNALSSEEQHTFNDDSDLVTTSTEVQEGCDEFGEECEATSDSEQPDWSVSSLTESEQQTVIDMAENGEIDIPAVDDDKSEPEHSELHLPDESGEFLGEKGNSEFIPSKAEAVEEMEKYGRESAEYKGNYPDFSPFTTHESPWGKLDCQVVIGHMTDNRENDAWEFGDRPRGAGHDSHYDLGNFAQADNALLDQLRKLNPNTTVKDIVDFRKDNRLTWHECADGKTMQLVPTVIHDACRHSGGVSEMKYRMAMGDVTLPGND